jgi:feruloyl esterase
MHGRASLLQQSVARLAVHGISDAVRCPAILAASCIRLARAIARSSRASSFFGALAFAIALLAPLAAAAAQTPSADAPVRCAGLKTIDFASVQDAPTQILETRGDATVGQAKGLCVIDGYVATHVGFRLFLPEEGWNGKFLQVGSGGHAGFLTDTACATGLAKGYACLINDLGHKGTGLDSEWARGNLQARVDWGYRATHVATLAARAIISAFYGRGPRRSYFTGCSTGGRQALQEAEKFPWDYDGVVAGAPPIRLSDLYVHFLWATLANRDVAGHMLLAKADLDLLNRASLAACDMDDGLRDGLVSRPQMCGFSPARLRCRAGQSSGCLTELQVEAAEKIYAGPPDATGRPIFGSGAVPGAERLWARYYLDSDSGDLPYMFALTRNGLGDLFFDPAQPHAWKGADFDFATDYKRLDVMQALYDSSNPDFGRFAQAGGKVILYIGLGDPSMPNTVIDFFGKVERVAGGPAEAAKFARLFLLPGVDHCSGGPGADQVDFLQYLDDWVDRGMKPDALVATHGDGGTGTFTRPVYPYPAYARYRGRGDPTKAESFERALPPAGPR